VKTLPAVATDNVDSLSFSSSDHERVIRRKSTEERYRPFGGDQDDLLNGSLRAASCRPSATFSKSLRQNLSLHEEEEDVEAAGTGPTRESSSRSSGREHFVSLEGRHSSRLMRAALSRIDSVPADWLEAKQSAGRRSSSIEQLSDISPLPEQERYRRSSGSIDVPLLSVPGPSMEGEKKTNDTPAVAPAPVPLAAGFEALPFSLKRIGNGGAGAGAGSSGDSRKLRILIASCDGVNMRGFYDGISTFQARNYLCRDEVQSVEEAESAVQRSLKECEPYDVVVVNFDVSIGSGGLEAVKAVRTVGYRGRVLGVTNKILPEDVEKFIASGADRVTTRPAAADQFLKSIIGM